MAGWGAVRVQTALPPEGRRAGVCRAVSSPPSSAWARGGRWHCALASHLCPAREGLCVHFAFAEKAHEGHTGPREPPKPALLPGSGPEMPATHESLRTATSLAAQVAPADLTLQPARSQRPAPPHRTEETEPRRTLNPAGGSEAKSPLFSDSLRSPDSGTTSS